MSIWRGASCLPEVANVYPEIAGRRKQGGTPISQIDAAIALSRDAQLATRNVSDFADFGITVANLRASHEPRLPGRWARQEGFEARDHRYN